MVDWLGGGAFARYKLTESSSVPLSSLYLIVLFLHLYLTSNPSHLNSIGKSMICSREDEEEKKKTAEKHLCRPATSASTKVCQFACYTFRQVWFWSSNPQFEKLFWRFGADNWLKRSDPVSKCQKCPYQWKPCWLPALSVNSVGGWSVKNIRWHVVMISINESCMDVIIWYVVYRGRGAKGENPKIICQKCFLLMSK